MVILENSFLHVEISTHGAELKKVFGKEKQRDFLWNGDEKYWKRTAPHLFPIVGKLKDDFMTIDKTKYVMSQHGFARDMEFELIENDNTYACFRLQYSEDTLKVFPYKFEYYVTYELSKNKILVNWLIKNIDDKEMYFSVGAHPAFNLISNSEGKFSDYLISLKFNEHKESKQLILENSLISDSKNIDYSVFNIKPKLFKNDALIYSNIDKIKLKNKKLETSIEVEFKNFPYVGIWSPYNKEEKTIAPFICIEPWFGIADTKDHDNNLKNKLGINRLAPKDFMYKGYSMKFK